MARIKINLPSQFPFQTLIPVRITDINYGGHVGNDTILTLVHEARMQYLHSLGFTELDFAGVGLIMSDAGIEFKNELFYGATVRAFVVAGDVTKVGFDIFYKLVMADTEQVVALAKTGMVCFDYSAKKVVAVPAVAVEKVAGSK